VDANLAPERHGHTEDLTGVREADIGLKTHRVVQPALDEVSATQRVLNHRDALTLDEALGNTGALILHAELSDQTGVNVPLEKARLHMNIAKEFATLKERIHGVLLFEEGVFILQSRTFTP
jgi:hypothetical protein